MLAALLATNEAILRAESPEELYLKVCDAVVHGGKFAAAMVLLAQPDQAWARVVAMTGGRPDELQGLISLDANMPEGGGLVGFAYRSGQACVSNDIASDSRMDPWRALLRKKGVSAGIALPLIGSQHTLGVLVLYAVQSNVFDDELIEWLERLAANVVHALGNFQRDAARKHAEAAQRQSEARFRTLVECSSDWYWEQDGQERLNRIEGRYLVDGHSRATPLLGKSLCDTPGIVPGAADFDRLRAAIAARKPFRDLVYAYRDEHGLMRYVSVTGEPITDEDGMHAGYRGTSRDVTERRRGLALVALEHSVTRSLAEAESSRKALQAVLRVICESEQWETGGYFRVEDDAGTSRLIVGWNGPSARKVAVDYYKTTDGMLIPPGGLIGQVATAGKPIWHADMAESHTTWRQRVRQTDQRATFSIPVLADGKVLGVFAFASPAIREPDAPLLRTLHVVGEQVGQFMKRKQAEQVLRESEARFRALTDLSSDWYWEVDAEFRFTRIEGRHVEGGETVAGEDVLGKRRWETGLDIEAPLSWEAHRVQLGQNRAFRDGERRYISVSGEPIHDHQGAFFGYRGVGRDITDRKRAENRIQHLAMHDGLTGLPNRVAFGELLNLALQSAKRKHVMVAVLFVDLDRFKVINDTLGHEAGDVLLKSVSQQLRGCVRSSDVVARLGGDEFVVLLQQIGSADEVAAVARVILTAISSPLQILGHDCSVSASVGISMFPLDAEDEPSLMKNADMAMYLAKDQGKNNFQFFSKEIKARSSGCLAMEAQLRGALERGEFQLHYQAKIDLKSRAIAGVEALLRWVNPTLGAVPPSEFIALAEETGLILPIGRWVLHTACVQNVAWQAQGLPPVCMAVNLSPRQFADDDLTQDIEAVLRSTGMRADLLELEITESTVMPSPEHAIKLLNAIKDMGVRLAIDDIGTGYSSLAQLKRFPIDTLKVDRSFIRDVPHDADDSAITEAIIAIIAMAKTLGLMVVAEGVETPAQGAFLSERACDQAQGYLFSKPIPADQFALLLRGSQALPVTSPVTSK
jgi:diguanylate cyclase (GGDEF)-like protein/PAS domain S-box-containing protein